ncbi:substrate-binding periplasmic protein [Acinetobacter sp. c1-l78]|uniref:substrate-binding periplasmic protein n=1 Tax=Acinetobacter sp. c1-l78 TaxID=3342803 RepID=UPI0035B7196C
MLKSMTLLAACVITLTACSPKTETQNDVAASSAVPANDAHTDQRASFVSKLPANAPVYKVATTGKQPPFTYLDEYGNLMGMDIDIIRAIGEEQGFKVEFEVLPWPMVFPSVVDGKNDLAVSGISYNDERNEKYSLSKQYLFVPSAIMVKDSNIKSLADLAGKRFTCMTAAKQCNDISKAVPTATVNDEATTYLSFAALAQGRTDAIGEDMQLLQYFAKKHPDQKVHIIPYETEKDLPAQQIIMAAKGRTELINKVNEGIDKLTASGKIKEIEKKWLDNPY